MSPRVTPRLVTELEVAVVGGRDGERTTATQILQPAGIQQGGWIPSRDGLHEQERLSSRRRDAVGIRDRGSVGRTRTCSSSRLLPLEKRKALVMILIDACHRIAYTDGLASRAEEVSDQSHVPGGR